MGTHVQLTRLIIMKGLVFKNDYSSYILIFFWILSFGILMHIASRAEEKRYVEGRWGGGFKSGGGWGYFTKTYSLLPILLAEIWEVREGL